MHLQAKKTDTALEQLRVLAGTLVPTLSAWLASRANCYSSMVMSEVSEKSSVGVALAGQYILADVTKLGELLRLVMMSSLPNASHVHGQ